MTGLADVVGLAVQKETSHQTNNKFPIPKLSNGPPSTKQKQYSREHIFNFHYYHEELGAIGIFKGYWKGDSGTG